MNKQGIIGIALLVIAIGIFSFNFNGIVENCTISDDYNLQLVDSHDIVFKDNGYDIDGTDAFLVYDLGIERTLCNGKLYLENTTERNINLQIYYSSEGTEFCEENSYCTYIESGSSELILPLINTKVRNLRVDFCEPENTSVTLIKKITVAEKNIINILKLFVSSYNLIRLLLIYGVLLTLYMLSKKRHSIIIILEKHPYCTAFLGIFACTTFLYWNYITGKVYYIFTDIANDSLFQTYPSLLYLARRIQNGNLGSTFSFSTGLGSSRGSVILGLDNWVAFFGEEHVAYLLGISQWLKVSLSGCFAYIFSRCYGNRYKVSFLIALAYAFNADIIIRGAWVSYPNIAFLLIVWMTAYEQYHQKKNAIFLPLATVLFFYSVGMFQKVFWGVVLAVYIAFRIISENRICKGTFLRLCKAETFYFGVMLLGIGNTLYSGLKKVTSSVRFQAGVSQFEEAAATNIFSSFEDILTGFLRTVGMTINGITEGYVGTYNYLAAPAFYCGILVFLLIPFSIYNMPKRKRNAYLLGCLVVIIYILVVPIRRIANGFADDSYRLSSLWIIAFMIITAMSGLNVLFSSKENIGSKSQLIFNITVGATLVGLALSLTLGYVARFNSWVLSTVFVIVYAVAINAALAGWLNRERIITVLLVCVMFEVSALSWGAINDRSVVTKQQLEQREFYNSSSLDAVNYLKSNDTDWYRLEKKSGEVFMCDAWAQDYYGTVSYIGGTGISSSIQNIYRTLGLPLQETRVMLGSGGNIGIDALWGVKYFLNRENVPIDVYGLTYLETVGNIDIYKNELALPLAYTYDQSISYDDLLKYPMSERRNIMLRNCVLEETEVEAHIAEKNCELMEVRAEKIDGRYNLQLPKNGVLVLKLEAKESNFGVLYSIDTNNNVARRYFNLTKGEECVIEICMEDIAAVWFETEENIQNLQFYYQDADIYYADMIEAIENLRKNTLLVNDFDDNYICGEIYCENDTILATSIPYDANWEIYVDGEVTEPQNINIGFLGAELEKGEHQVKFIYKTETWGQNNRYMVIWGMIAVALTACEAYRKRKLPLKL